MTNHNRLFKKSYIEREELAEIPYDNHFLQSIEKGMGELPLPAGASDDLMLMQGYDSDTVVDFTDAQQEALDEYEQIYYRFMEAGQALIESFGYNAVYGE
tara:strand:- start:146 stop:445 length:300 start_codon:yes stop_codon:yes gene_type:complete